jgi:MFS family permease
LIALTILVSALGYFVDIFDLLLFSIVRVQSLKDLGVAEADLLSVGIHLLNAQMAGLLLGGLVWGVIGDKYGRVSVLFGSILFYSLGSIGNGFVTNVGQYALLRFISGLGLAGELGICVTLASELLPRGLRGLGTTFIATIGVLGATAAALVADKVGWRDAYIIGGVMGLGLLVLRLKVRESALYLKMEKEKKDPKRGNLLLFFRKPDLLRRYIKVILIGAPIWAVVGIFITFTPEFAKDFGMAVLPNAGTAVFYCYIGLAFGDMFSGLLSQILGSRRKSIAVSLCLLIFFTALFVTVRSDSLSVYYGLCGLLGFAAGYWAMFVQVGAEQFGTNLRATAATSIPNVVRGLTIPMAAGFHALIPSLGVTGSGLAVVTLVAVMAFVALWNVRETFHADLDYLDL